MTKGYKPEKNGFDVWIWNKLILYTFCFDKDVRHFSNDSLEHRSSIKLARIFYTNYIDIIRLLDWNDSNEKVSFVYFWPRHIKNESYCWNNL